MSASAPTMTIARCRFFDGMRVGRLATRRPASCACPLWFVRCSSQRFRRERAGVAFELQPAEREVEARLREAVLRRRQRVLRMQEIELGRGSGVVLRADEAERLLRQRHRLLGSAQRIALGLELALRFRDVVVDRCRATARAGASA